MVEDNVVVRERKDVKEGPGPDVRGKCGQGTVGTYFTLVASSTDEIEGITSCPTTLQGR